MQYRLASQRKQDLRGSLLTCLYTHLFNTSRYEHSPQSSFANSGFLLHQEVDDEEERNKLREVSKRLYAQLQEAEKKHQEEKERLQVTHTQFHYVILHIVTYPVCLDSII